MAIAKPEKSNRRVITHRTWLAVFCMLLAMGISSASAQVSNSDIDLFKKIDQMPGSQPPVNSGSNANAATKREPTVITASKQASFDGKLKVAIFEGDVRIKDPQFSLSSDKLTVYFKKDNEPAKPGDKNVDKTKPGDKSKPANTPAPTPAATAKPSASASAGPGLPGNGGTGGLERALAEGNVIVESDRPDPNGGPPTHYVGTGAKVEYNAINGEAVLYGWPQIHQGINTIVATEESTVIHLFRDGKMNIVGPTKVNINDPGPGQTLQKK